MIKGEIETDDLPSPPIAKIGSKPSFKYKNKNSLINLNYPKTDIIVEKNKLRRIKSGRIIIEASIDLHGLSLKQAEQNLKVFVGESFRRKKRFILVITGKGRNSKPNVHGNTQTIRGEINRWLLDGFYRDKVQYVSRALDKHGGDGAQYFFLKKSQNIFS